MPPVATGPSCLMLHCAVALLCAGLGLFYARVARVDAHAPQAVTAVWSNPQHLDLFITDATGKVASTWWEPGCGWQPWFAIHPESATAAPGQPVTAVWSKPQHLDLFVTGGDGRVMSTWWEAAQSWQPWFAIHPEFATAAPGQPVTAVWSNPQHLDLFVTGRDGRVMSTWWEAAKSWQPWFDIFPDALALRDVRNVITQLYDRGRTGANLHETQLTPAALQSGRFGKRVQWQVEGQILAQPLYVREVPVVGNGQKNLVFVATAANLVYAFDADGTDQNAGPVFKVRLGASDELLDPGDPKNRPPYHTAVRICDETFPHFIGVTATPVIDDATGIMYVVNYDTAQDQHVLHALDLHRSLAEVRPPVVIAAPGFDPHFGRNRAALLLMNEVVYVAFGSFICDNPMPYSGWVFGYRTVDLAQTAAWRVPVTNGAGIWQSGRGLVGSPDGSIYLETGNDNAPPPVQPSLANSFVKLHTSCHGQGLTLERSFTLANSTILSIGDTDLGSSGPLLLPGGLLIGGGKQGRAYVLDAGTLTLTQDVMGADGFQGFQAFTNTYHSDPHLPPCPTLTDAWCKAPPPTLTLQSSFEIAKVALSQQCFLPTSCYQINQGLGPNIHAGFVYWQGATQDGGMLYALAEKEYLRAFRYHLPTAHVDEQPAATAMGVRASDGMPGGAVSVSANGTGTAWSGSRCTRRMRRSASIRDAWWRSTPRA